MNRKIWKENMRKKKREKIRLAMRGEGINRREERR